MWKYNADTHDNIKLPKNLTYEHAEQIETITRNLWNPNVIQISILNQNNWLQCNNWSRGTVSMTFQKYRNI